MIAQARPTFRFNACTSAKVSAWRSGRRSSLNNQRYVVLVRGESPSSRRNARCSDASQGGAPRGRELIVVAAETLGRPVLGDVLHGRPVQIADDGVRAVALAKGLLIDADVADRARLFSGAAPADRAIHDAPGLVPRDPRDPGRTFYIVRLILDTRQTMPVPLSNSIGKCPSAMRFRLVLFEPKSTMYMAPSGPNFTSYGRSIPSPNCPC